MKMRHLRYEEAMRRYGTATLPEGRDLAILSQGVGS